MLKQEGKTEKNKEKNGKRKRFLIDVILQLLHSFLQPLNYNKYTPSVIIKTTTNSDWSINIDWYFNDQLKREASLQVILRMCKSCSPDTYIAC